MLINEIFYSLQGEGKLMGLPTVFIRTSTCNLRCSYCDTAFAYKEGTEMSIDTILKNIETYHCSHICITGGEPLLQKEVVTIIKQLIDLDYLCSIETNGSIDITPLLRFQPLVISLDVKCPSSRMSDQMDSENIRRLRPQDQIKFIIGDKQDFSYAIQILKDTDTPCPMYMQPVWGLDLSLLASWILDEHLPLRLGLQQHKIIWGSNTHH